MDELLTKQMPHSLEAEQAVLGSMLIDSRCIADVVSVLHASDFYVTINREIFETMLSMFNYSVPVDAVTVLQQMELRGVRRDDSQRYLGELMNVTPTAANVLEYADIVRDKSLLRSIAEAVAGITDMVFNEHDEAGDILEAAEKRIFAHSDKAEQEEVLNRYHRCSSACLGSFLKQRRTKHCQDLRQVYRIWIECCWV